MKERIQFHKAFRPACIISAVIILCGVIGLFTRGINFGLDYRPGLIEEIRMAPTVMSVTYSGSANVAITVASGQTDVVISGLGAENETRVFNYSEYQTVSQLASALSGVPQVSAKVLSNGNAPTSSLFVSANVANRLTSTPYSVYASGIVNTDVDSVREALSSIEGITVQQLGSGNDVSYQIRMADKGGADNQSTEATMIAALGAKYGADNIAIIKNDFIGSSFSSTIARQSFLLLAATVLLIWVYAAFRFHWDFALGAVIALLHDAAIMVTFIVWSQMEFSTMTVAAILTIVGYSINATIVILDRVRSLLPQVKTKNFTDIIDQAITDTLSRSIITTATTLFAVLALFIFTSGSVKNFALALVVGLLSGCYSSMCISGAFIAATRKSWKPEYGIHHSLKARTGVMTYDGGASV